MENKIIEITTSDNSQNTKANNNKNISLKQLNIFKCLKCTDNISLNINPHNFSCSYECDNGDIGEDLFFGTVNQFISLLKTEDHLDQICVNCNSDNNNNNNNNNTEINGLEYFAYCKLCKKHLCPLCIGNHLKIKKKKHDIIFLGNLSPSEEEINEAKKNLNERIVIINKIIEKINKIKNKMLYITNRITKLLKDEILFVSKYINNFQKEFQNYHYLMNFHNINEYISKFKNEKIYNFYNEADLLKQLHSLVDISKDIDIKKKEMEEEKIFNSIKKIENYEKFCENPFGEFKFNVFTGVEFCKKDNNFILAYDNYLKFFHLLKNKNIYLDYEYTFKNSINSILLSKNEEELYVSENNFIYIFIYDYKENKYIKPEGKDEESSSNILSHQGNKKFSKLFQLDNGTLITVSDDSKLYVWLKNEDKKNKNIKYYVYKMIPSFWGCYEFLQVNDYYFVILMRDCNLKFFDCEEVNEIKTVKIKYGDYLKDKYNHIVKINKDYLIVGVKNYYILISIRTMEIIQYYTLTNIRNIISIHKYDYDNLVLFIGKPNEDENVIFQYKFDEKEIELTEISHFTNQIEKYGDCKYSLFNNNIIIRYYYYYSSTTNKRFEMFI